MFAGGSMIKQITSKPCHKKLQITQKQIDTLKVEIIFYPMINMKIIFHFNIIILTNEHLYVNLLRFYKTCMYL